MAKRNKTRADGRMEKTMTINGKRVHFYGQSEAEILRKIRDYKIKEETGPLFKAVAEQWHTQYEKDVEYNTYYKSMVYYDRAIEHFGDMYIKQITPADINVFYNRLARKGYARKTVANQKTILGNIFRYAIVKGHITDNPLTFVSLPKNLKQNKRELPSDEDIKKVKESVQGEFGLLPFFLMYTGCRKSEALALQFKDIDLNRKKIKITKALYYKYNRPQIKQPKTENGIREIPLLDKLIPHLPQGKPDDFIFSVDGTTPYPQSYFQRRWKKYQQQTGITATPHQLRHAYATMLYEAGIDEKLAQELMGHADIATTKNIYTHIRLSRMEDAANKLNSIDF